MNTEEIVVEEVVETPIVATEVETKLPNITVNDQTEIWFKHLQMLGKL